MPSLRVLIAACAGRTPSIALLLIIKAQSRLDGVGSTGMSDPPREPTAVSSARISGETTTSSILSMTCSRPSCVTALSRCFFSARHCAHPRGVRCASANFSDL